MATHEIDWNKIAEATGLPNDELARIRANWGLPVQTWEEVVAGRKFEEANRLSAADIPGGLTDQIRAANKK